MDTTHRTMTQQGSTMRDASSRDITMRLSWVAAAFSFGLIAAVVLGMV